MCTISLTPQPPRKQVLPRLGNIAINDIEYVHVLPVLKGNRIENTVILPEKPRQLV